MIRNLKLPLIVALVLLGVTFVGRAYSQETDTFAFSGFIQYQQSSAVSGLSVGDAFVGSFTFNPQTTGVAASPPNNTLHTDYWAITSWTVTIPTNGLTFGGSLGEISVGNDTSYYASDRYIVTMFPDTNQPPILVSGHTFSHFQIDLFEFGLYQPATMLNDDSLPLTPPDLALVPASDRLGHFLFADASFQNRMTSLTNVPEPSPVALAVAGLVAAALFQLAKRRSWSGKQVGHTTIEDYR
jgi:hypothetical protein